MKSVKQTLQLVELIAEKGPCSLAELTELIGLPKTTVQRGLTTLKDMGWIKPSRPEGKPEWILSGQFLSLANPHNRVDKLRQVALPHMIRLRDLTNETTFLASYEIDRMHVVDFLDSHQTVRSVGAKGSVPLHCSSTGKACLALLSDKAVDRLLKTLPTSRPEQENPIEADVLKAQLVQIRQRGYYVANNEWSTETAHIGAAIKDSHGAPIGGMGIAIPVHRLAEHNTEAIGRELIRCCQKISSELSITE